MLALKESYYKPVQAVLTQLFYDVFFAPLIKAADLPKLKLNSSESEIIRAIQSGRVVYKDGVFSGQFNAKISRELSAFAVFDKRSNTWVGKPSPLIKAAAVLSDKKRADLRDRLNRAIDESEERIKETINTLSFSIDLPIFSMSSDIQKDLQNIGVMPKIDERTERFLRNEYSHNMALNIVDENNPGQDWASVQVNRLREMVKEYQTTETQSNLIQLIQSQWNTSAAKAKFLASQETRLFFGTLSRDRAARTGVRRYKWSTSHDERVRQDHKKLQGTIVEIDGPGPIVDHKTGRRAHAGEDYGCRCGKIWVLE